MNLVPKAIPQENVTITMDAQINLASHIWFGGISDEKKTTNEIDNAHIETPILDNVKYELFLFSIYWLKLSSVLFM